MLVLLIGIKEESIHIYITLLDWPVDKKISPKHI